VTQCQRDKIYYSSARTDILKRTTKAMANFTRKFLDRIDIFVGKGRDPDLFRNFFIRFEHPGPGLAGLFQKFKLKFECPNFSFYLFLFSLSHFFPFIFPFIVSHYVLSLFPKVNFPRRWRYFSTTAAVVSTHRLR
jgi:hypothetical protein